MGGTNHARKGRAKQGRVLAMVAGGRLPVREVLRDGHGALGTCPVWRVVLAAPSIGPSTMRDVFERSHVWPFIPLQDLTKLERQRIIDELPERVK